MAQITLQDISLALTELVIDRAFKQKTNSQDSVKHIDVSRAAPTGEGLLSAVYRIHVTGEQHTCTFIVKALINNIVLRNTLQSSKYFKREAKFFTDIMPAYKDIQKSLGAKEVIQEYTPIYYSSCWDGENDYILIEDLSEKNCVSISEFPTLRERNMAIRTLAHLHAVSIALRIKKPEDFMKLSKDIPELYFTEEQRNWYSEYLMSAIEIDRKVIREYFEPSSIYYKKFEDIVTNDPYGQMIELVTNDIKHPVLCHGDAWCPNFLCSGDKAISIDFQLYRCASLATDITYLVMLCSNLLKGKQDVLDALDLYYGDLAYFLKDMGLVPSEVFSRAAFDDEVIRYGRFGFIANLTSIPLIAGERFDAVTPDMMSWELDPGQERMPLEKLWKLSPIKREYQSRLVNLVRAAVDLELI